MVKWAKITYCILASLHGTILLGVVGHWDQPGLWDYVRGGVAEGGWGSLMGNHSVCCLHSFVMILDYITIYRYREYRVRWGSYLIVFDIL